MHKIWNRGVITAFLCGSIVVAVPQTTYAKTTPSVMEVTLAEIPEEGALEAEVPVPEALTEMPEELSAEASAKEAVAAEEAEMAENSESSVETAVEAQPQISAEDAMRQRVTEFGIQLLGAPYAAGGSSPQTGFDCSGFIRYIFQYGIGIQLERSSTYQSRQGIQISENEMKPGDLIFYGKGSRINHVAMYIGNGQVVHASTYETGVKTSPWNYRPHVRIMRVIGVL